MLVTALLQAHVIVAADPGQQRHLLPAQPAHPPAAAGIRKADVLRRDQLTPGPQVLPDQVLLRHDTTIGSAATPSLAPPLPGTPGLSCRGPPSPSLDPSRPASKGRQQQGSGGSSN